MQLAAGRTPKNSAVYAKLDADLASDKLQYSVYVGHLFAHVFPGPTVWDYFNSATAAGPSWVICMVAIRQTSRWQFS